MTTAWFLLFTLVAAEEHELPLLPENVHWGYFDASVPPVLRVRSGDVVTVETMVARGLERLYLAGATEADFPESMRRVEAEVTERGPGAHPLTGPIFVEGAEPSDRLAVTIEAIDFLVPIGVSGFLPDGGTLPEDFPYGGLRLFHFDIENRMSEFASGVVVPLAPFFGTIGVAPPVLLGRISSGPPGYHVGNLDLKELVAGTTLYLPVHVPGALLSIGDGHAAQGDGEVSGTAIETALVGRFRIRLEKNRPLRWPRAETPTHFLTLGLHPDLDEAARLATREMVDFLVTEKSMTEGAAYILCSVAMDLRVTQLVDGTKGIHAMLAKSLFR
ncbi:MAG TPA: acetamidase/formamidase family protein [Vicinamibacteria bacterium]|nr:acetamidase/formamidase family protein [Vicinamibacteria bacterium]